MKIFNNKKDLKDCLLDYKTRKKTIGFVPTMGALHEGHLSLIENAKLKNHIVVVSIFVNPTQFDNVEDLKQYPKTIENDIKLLRSVSCDILFSPSVEEIYSEDIASEKFNFDGLEHQMEGAFRKGHFDGVGTIVKTLFEIIEPNKAYFGEKDFQQLLIVKKMVKKKNLPVKIKGCEIFREQDGLAMSSRNARLTTEEKKAATIIYQTLHEVKKKTEHLPLADINKWVIDKFNHEPLFTLEYFTIAEEETLKSVTKILPKKNYRAFIAAYAREVRLIDTISLNS